MAASVADPKLPVEALLIPVPLHVPPGLAAVSVKGREDWQNGPAGVIVPSGTEFTTITCVSVLGQGPPIEYVMVLFTAVVFAGLKAPLEAFVIPGPLHVPPV